MANKIDGTNNDDTLIGGIADDKINGKKGDDLIYAGAGDDDIKGGYGNDTIYGGEGDDKIDAGKGDDFVDGGAGDDKIKGGYGNDTIYGGEGDDKIDAGKGDDIVHGGAGDDDIKGGYGNDTIYGGEGNDKIDAGKGDDFVDGGAGDDEIEGKDGNDTLLGGTGNDTIDGGKGDDLIEGGEGDDLLVGDKGADIIYGGAGNDTIYGDKASGGGSGSGGVSHNDYLEGGAGNDILYGGQGNDTVLGGEGDDILYGDKGPASGSGSGGSGSGVTFNDYLDGGAGNDQVFAQQGDDTGHFQAEENWETSNYYDGGTGVDTLEFTMTYGEALAAQDDLADFEAFLAANYDPTSNNGPVFQFTTFDLAASNWEDYNLTLVNTGPTANADTNAFDAVTESGVNPGNTPFAGDPSATGNVLLGNMLGDGEDTDPDHLDVLTVVGVSAGAAPGDVAGNVGAEIVGIYGKLTLDSDGGYGYVLDNNDADTDALAQGQVTTDVFTYTINDLAGVSSTTTLTITITGTNDVPVITNAATDAEGTVVEAGHLDDGTAVAGTPTVSGQLSASDVDSGATETWSIEGTPSTTYGSLAITDTATGAWTYTLDNNDADTQALAEGDSVDETYTVRVTDDFGAYVDQTVTITITGTNDVPVITNAATDAEGTVVEAGHLDDGTAVAGTPTVSGQLSASDVDSGATETWSIQGTPSTTYGSLAITDTATGAWTYTLDNGDADTQALAEGDSVEETYTVRVTDDFGAYVDQTVTITITGTNDVPVITNAATDAAGTVVEAGHLDDGTAVAGTPTVSGQLSASDVDSGATETWSIQGTPSTTYGSLAITDTATGAWTYTLDNGDVDTQALAEGDSVEETYTVRVTDDFGAYVDQTVTITITGTNDVPVITNAATDAAGTVVEAGHLDDGTAVAGTPTVSGQLSASDVDSGATETWSIQGTPSTTYGSLAITDTATGAWTYTLDNGDVDTQALAEGASVDETYTVRVTDDFGAYVDQTVTITITGTNDVPVITNAATDAAGTVVEAGHLDDGTAVAGTPTVSGQLSASDVDSGATETWSIQGTPSTTYGSLAITDTATGAWTYTLDNGDVDTQALAEGDSVEETYTVRVTDDFGAYVDQTVTITITGTNDVPVITNAATDAAGTVVEAGHLDDGTAVAGTPTVSGQLSASDVDSGATETWSIQGTPSTTYGSLAITDTATGAWTYTLDNGDVDTQALAEGDSVEETYTVRVTDDFGAYVDQTVTITITGTNDVPVITNAATDAAGTVVEAGHLDDGTAVAGTPTVSGQLSASDVDSGATETWSIQGTPSTTYGSLAITDTATGAWTYTLDNGDVDTQALAEGDSVEETYTVRVTDDFGAYVDQTVTITITGTNDVPVITNAATDAEGTVVEAGHLDDGTAVAGTPTVSGQLSASDVDSGATETWSIQGTPSTTYGSLAITDTATGAWTYTLDNNDPDTQALAEGASVEETYTVRVTDDFGAYVDQTVTITITGTNDVPVITNAATDAAGTVVEAGHLDDGTAVAGTPTVSGQLSASDVDSGATETWSIQGTPSTTYGSLAITDTATGAWTYTLDNNDADTQALAEGASVEETYTVRVTDDFGAYVDQTVTITITGTNDVPVITNAATDAEGTVVEAGHLDDGTAVAGTPTVSGQLSASDVDSGATETWSIQGTPSTTYGSLAITDALTGAWTYTLDNGDVDTQALAEGASVEETYTVRVTDDFGAYVDQTVTITITGTNDVPVITNAATDAEGTVVEAGHEDDGTAVAGTPTVSGQLSASDVDSGATETWSIQGTPSTTYGSLAITDTATGAWTYTLDNGDVDTQALAEGASVDETYTVRVTDDFGAYVDQTVTITITGTNDVPVITNAATDAEGTVVEAGHLDDGTAVAGTPTVSGQLSASDVDSGATETWTIQGTPSTTYGSLAITDTATGAWTYTLDNGDVDTQALAEGASVEETYTVRVTDDFGAYVDQTVTITITGTNDVPVITNAATDAEGTVVEAGHLDDGTAVAGTPTVSGQLSASDVDSGATETWSIQGTPSTTYGSLAITDTATGAWTYTLDNNDPDTQALAEGASVEEDYTVRVTDDFGAYVDQTVTITITGTNDVPVITNAATDAAGTVVEAGHLDDGTAVAGTPTVSGQLSASDVDSGATETWSIQGTPSTTYGSLAITDTATGAWTYTLDNEDADTQALAEGASVDEDYTVRVTDEFGAYVDQTVTITITGTNDVPVIGVADTTGSITELDNGAPGENATLLSDTSTIAFSDVDLTDTHGVTPTLVSATDSISGAVTERGVFTPTITNASTGDGAGVVTWTFEIEDADIDDLVEGQTLTQVYDIEIEDDHGATATETVTITITGRQDNNPPVITSEAHSGSITELADGAIGENLFVHKLAGSVSNDIRYLEDLDAIVDPDAIVSTETVGSHDVAEVTALADGGHLVVYSAISSSNDDTSGWGVYGQRYDLVGDKVGSNFLINTTTSSTQIRPSAAGYDDGGFVVVWESYNGSQNDIHGQQYNASGVKVGTEFVVDTSSNSAQQPSVEVLTDGNFVVHWHQYNGSGTRDDTHARIFEPNASGNPTPATGAFLTNTTTASDQRTDGFIAETVAALSGGGFVTVWQDRSGADGSGLGIFARLYDNAGVAQSVGGSTNEFLVNTTTSGDQYYASVGALEDGGFVVTWSDPNSADGSGWGVFAQRFDADGTPVDNEFLVNSYTNSTQVYSKVQGLEDGGFVVVWQSRGVDGDNEYSISGQRYAADGSAVNGEFIVNNDRAGRADLSSLAVREDGALVVTWRDSNSNNIEQKIIESDADIRYIEEFEQDAIVSTETVTNNYSEVTALADGGHLVVYSAANSSNDDTSGWGVYGQRYDLEGDKVGSNFLINTTTSSTQIYPSAAGYDDGGFVVVWEGSGSSGYGIYGQQYNASGVKVGTEFVVDTSSNNAQQPSVEVLTDGNFVVHWQQYNGSGTRYDTHARIFEPNASGNPTPATGAFLTDTTTASDQRTEGWIAETVAALSGGGFVTVWQDASGADGSGDGIFARLYDNAGVAQSVGGSTNEFLVNTTTSGSQRYASVGALEDGGFVVTWSDPSGADGSGNGVFAQRFDADGAPVDSEFLVNSYTNSTQYLSKVQGLEDGGFVVVWQSYGVDGDNDYSISGQRYAADGSAVNGEFIVNNDRAGRAELPSLAVRDDGALVVTWIDSNSNNIEQKIIEYYGGVIEFEDLDLADVHTISVVENGAGYRGELTTELLDPATGDGSGQVRWDFSVNDADLDDLAEGEVLTQVYTIEIDDGQGTAAQDVTVTIEGTNDAPEITVESGDSAAETLTETNAGLTSSGTLSVGDVDTSDTVAASVVSVNETGTTSGLANAALLAMLSVDAGDVIDNAGSTGAINWGFDSGLEAFDYLAVGESLVLEYTVRATDSQGAIDDQAVTITINGTSDNAAPVIDSAPQAGVITELIETLELSALNGSNGFVLNGIDANDLSGRSVASAGDVNGDGFDDVIIGALGADPNGNTTGESYVVFGQSGGFSAALELSALNGSNGFVLNGIDANDQSGYSVASAGDVNGDGYDDVVIGAREATPNGTQSGESYVVFGQSGGFSAVLELSSLDGSNGFVLNGIDVSDFSGHSVASAGDVNGDGYDDVIIGAGGADPNGNTTGESYVVFGQSGGFSAALELSTLNGSNGFVLNGIDAYDGSGWSVASAGDVNGDGYDDVIIGAGGADPNGSRSGESYVVFGQSGGFSASLNLSALNGSNGFVLNGIDRVDQSGFSVASAGDVNGDGFDDLIIGARGPDPNGISSGESYVVFGQSGGFSAALELSTLDGSNGFVLNGIDRNDFSGESVASAGDVNGDGFDDVIIGASRATPNGTQSGESYVVFGQSGGFSAALELSALNGSNGFVLNGIDAFDESGFSVASAGDVNGDGFDDLIIGAYRADPNGSSSGESYVVFGASGEVANGTITFDDADLPDNPTASILGAASVTGGTASPTAAQANALLDNLSLGAVVDNPDGSGSVDWTYSVASGEIDFLASGETVELTFTVEVNDNAGGSDTQDVVITIAGSDVLTGTSGNDTLTGGAGNDTLIGGAGDDTLTGGPGDDFLTGGAGDDLFVFSDGDGADTITDFSAGDGTDDVIDFSAVAAVGSFADVQTAASQQGADTLIDLGSGDEVTLTGVNVGDLHDSDFLV